MELAQALSLLFLPWTLVAILRARLMTRLNVQDLQRARRCARRLTWHRVVVQAIGLRRF
jgi:hypothetical protein